MGTVIEALATTVAGERPFAKTSLKLTDEASVECLRRARRDASEIDLLVNAGIYHDRNLGEPALAALIQEDVGANLGHPPVGGHGTFSFDVLNSIGGVLTGAYLVDGLMQSGTVRRGMVVAGDADPEPSKSEGFHFARSGGAMLLAWREGALGFTNFHLETFPEFEDIFHSAVGWHEPDGHRMHLRHRAVNSLVVAERPGFVERSVECAVRALDHFEERSGPILADTDLLVACHPRPEFGDLLADRLSLSRHLVVHLPEQLQRLHTAQPIAALESALADGRLGAARHVLIVTAGAGISVVAASYENAAGGRP